MEYSEIVDLIDATLESERRLAGSERAEDAQARIWSRNRQIARISRAGSTGITLVLATGERVMHERTFAQSAASVPRIARVITEHLTEYVQV